MTNRPSEDELLAYLEGESSPDESAAVRAAMEADPRLRAWIEAAARDRALTQMWGDLAAARTPGGMVEDAMALVERRALLDSESNQHKATGRSWRPHLAAAAVLLLAGGSAVILAPQIFGPGPASTQMAAAPESEDPA
ncbi:MAG: hypothetical protein VYC34_05245, partial [Planctomycetota bacterium]|nr:hypothetical protein [Planctomycetota bacterium]